MAQHIKIQPASGTWVVRAGGAVLGETTDALAVSEGRYDDVIYFPRKDLAMAFLDQTDTVTHCPHKGDATYFSIITKSQTLKDAGWSYENPLDGAQEIAGHVAFYSSETVAVEEV